MICISCHSCCLKNILAMTAEHFMQLICSDFKGRSPYIDEAEERTKKRKWIFHLQHNSVVTKEWTWQKRWNLHQLHIHSTLLCVYWYNHYTALIPYLLIIFIKQWSLAVKCQCHTYSDKTSCGMVNFEHITFLGCCFNRCPVKITEKLN